jgi:hypothetical protein
MKTLLSSRILFALGFILLAAVNAIVLTGVASNRSGEPFSRIILTERELGMPYETHEENSGLALRLEWRSLGTEDEHDPYTIWSPPAWLDAEKLKELGFDVDAFLMPAGEEENYRHPLSREVFIVLEKDGASYRESLKRAEAQFEEKKKITAQNPGNEELRDEFETAHYRLKQEQRNESRLFAIDAGRDRAKLQGKYRDQSRFMIMKGRVQARYNSYEGKKVYGYISLNNPHIHVPLSQRRVFDSIPNRSGSRKGPRYEVELAFGQRLEPWIVAVKKIQTPKK